MGIIEPYAIRVDLKEYTRDGERLVAASSKVSLSNKTVDEIWSISDEEVEVWIRETFKRKHFSPWEHSTYTFVVDGLSRIASHQLVRHRIASYTQLSHRYSEGYLRNMAFEACRLSRARGADVECVAGREEAKRLGGKRARYEAMMRALYWAIDADLRDDELLSLVLKAFVLARKTSAKEAKAYLLSTLLYYYQLYNGVRREDARYILPGALRTRIVVTMNARELAQVFLSLRMCSRAQWEIRAIAWELWRELMRVHPRLFKYVGPSCVVHENWLAREPSGLDEYLSGEKVFTQERCVEGVGMSAIPACLRVARLV